MHIHIGYKDPNDKTSLELVRRMDIFLGIPSLLMDKDNRRRAMYGAPGSFRMKPYGVEYRTLSNFWIMNNELIGWAWDSTIRAIDSVNNEEFTKEQYEEAVSVIEKDDKDAARVLCEKYAITVPELVY